MNPVKLSACHPACPWDHVHVTEEVLNIYRETYPGSPGARLESQIDAKDDWESTFTATFRYMHHGQHAGMGLAEQLVGWLSGMGGAGLAYIDAHFAEGCMAWQAIVLPVLRTTSDDQSTPEERRLLTDAVKWADLEMVKITLGGPA